MEPSVDAIADEVHHVSFSTTATATTTTTATATTTTTATDINRTTSSGSEATSSCSVSSHLLSPHSTDNPSTDPGWIAIKALSASSIAFTDLCFLKHLGSGDISSVYLVELKIPPPPPPLAAEQPVSQALFAAKLTDKKEMTMRNKERRARTEREILEILDHPFLPTLYATIDCPSWSCLLTEYCQGGDLHVVRQRQPNKRFNDAAVRFYASEVVAALEYIHLLGIVYRDLKPENVLVRSDGHIMLTDFDLSLKCDDCTSTPAAIVTGGEVPTDASPHCHSICNESCIRSKHHSCIPAPAISCFHMKWKRKKHPAAGGRSREAPEVVAEPVDARSMSFVGTHEYLAPEIVSGEGHGSAVDWWTLGIFIFEMFYGVTPFRGVDHEHTLANIVIRALEFPKEPSVSAAAKDLIYSLLVKDPARRLGSTMGATAVKHHSFFQGVNWALLRRKSPPFVPPPLNPDDFCSERCPNIPIEFY